jgi:hypothetical protein
MKRCMPLLLAWAVGLAVPVHAAEGGKTYALISAIGSSIAYTRQKMATGSHLEPYERATVTLPNASLDAAALRGLENVVRQTDPEARFVYLRLNPSELDGVPAPKRGEVALGKLATALERMPERSGWHQVLLLAPRYVPYEREMLGSKLQGIGLYVQPFERSRLDPGDEINGRDDIEAISPRGEAVRASSFIAPYFYAQVWVLDARTLEVLYTAERFDLQRIYDPASAAISIERALPPETRGPMVESFGERASAKALRHAIGVVTVTEPRVVAPR